MLVIVLVHVALRQLRVQFGYQIFVDLGPFGEVMISYDRIGLFFLSVNGPFW